MSGVVCLVMVVRAYLVVVLYAGADYRTDRELTLFVERRCSHDVGRDVRKRLEDSLYS